MSPTESWLQHDGAAGNRRQATALASALGLAWVEIVLDPAAPARVLAPRRFPFAAQALGVAFAQALDQPMPRLAIGCGRQAALATRLLRQRGVEAVQILDPRLTTRHWDLVVAPMHDGLEGANVLTPLGSLNPVDEGWLAAARDRRPDLGVLPTPRTALLLGGPTAATALRLADIDQALDLLAAARTREGGNLWVCGSARTPVDWTVTLRQRCLALGVPCWFGPQDGDNPYAALLGGSHRLVVTADSANLLSEACATAAPVYVVGAQRARGRIARLIDQLSQRGRIRNLAADFPACDIHPLRETARIAAQVRQRLRLD